jgi:hypothetical protein
MIRQPHAGSPADAGTAEIPRLIPAAIKPPTGNTMNVEATCEIKTIAINIPTVSGFSGNSPSRNRVSAAAESPISYQRRAVSVRSAIGPHKNRQRLADTPIATIDAAIATEKPTRVRTNGNVMETKPLLMP